MTAILLGLVAAVLFGVSDYIDGLVSRRGSAWPVALLACIGALAVAALATVLSPGRSTPADLAWSALAGVGSGLGTVYLYRGLAAGRMGVVAPVSAVGSALIPVAFALVGGERPSVAVWLGIAVGLPGIWLVSREPDRGGSAKGLIDGLLAGSGFGLMFAALGQVPQGRGYLPLVVAEVVAMAVVLGAALVVGADPRPRRVTDWVGLVGGVLAGGAFISFMVATQVGLLTVAAVLSSLYPAITVLLAAWLLREAIHRGQAVGLLFCVATVALVAVG